MYSLGPYNQTPAIIVAHGYVGKVLGKTIHGILMHSTIFNVQAIVDRETAGKSTSEICQGVTREVPIVANLKEALKYGAEVAIVINELSEDNHFEFVELIRNKVDIINPNFEFLNSNEKLKKLSKRKKVNLIDLRDYKYIKRWADGSILNIKAKVVFVSGTDCGLGKRTAAYELAAEAKRQGVKAAFAATGQTGLLLGCDGGIIFDAIPTNYSAGAVEKLIVDLDKSGYELIFLEGQASLMHFGGSTSITLLHASNPHAILLVHDPYRDCHVEFGPSPIFKMCSLDEEINIIEGLSLPGGNKFKVVGVPTIGSERIDKVRTLTQLAVADVRKKGGAAILLNHVLEHLYQEYKWLPYKSQITHLQN